MHGCLQCVSHELAMSPWYLLLLVQLVTVPAVGADKTHGSKRVALCYAVWQMEVSAAPFAVDKGCKHAAPVLHCPSKCAHRRELLDGAKNLRRCHDIECLSQVPEVARVAAAECSRSRRHGGQSYQWVPGGVMR